MRPFLGLCLALSGLLAAAAATAAPIEVLRGCAQAGGQARGLDAWERQCPGLRGAIEDLGYSPALGDYERRELTATGLTDLAALAERYRAAKPERRPDISAVRGIVDALSREHLQSPSAWDAFKTWLRSLLPNDGGRTVSWFDRVWDRLASAAGVMTFMVYALLLVVAVLAASAIIRELRTAGLLSPRRAGAASQQRRAPATEVSRPPTLDRAPLPEQPALLLRLLVDGLSRRGRLHADRHLTHRELVGQAVLEDPQQRECLARVAGLAESLLYGPHARCAGSIEYIVEDGRNLLQQIERLSVVG